MYYIGWTVFFMDRKLKRWEVALLCGVLAALLWSAWAGQEQAQLAGQVIRLHVLANSDSQADQELKLAVRDRVLERAEGLYPQDATLEQAREILEDNLDELAAAGHAWRSAGSPPRNMETLPCLPGSTPPCGW